MMISVQCVFGRVRSPANSRTRIDIDQNASVEQLQDRLEEKHPQMKLQFGTELWKLKEPSTLRDIREGVVDVKDPSKIAELMDAFRPLSDYGTWEAGKIHVVVIIEELECPTGLLINIPIATRKGYIEKDLPKELPSSAAVPSEFLRYQQHKHFPILCNRPPEAVSPLPITLFHPIFGRFLDLCDSHPPTVQDNGLALDISTAMSNIYLDEATRAADFCSTLHKYGITSENNPTEPSGHRQTGGYYWNGFPLITLEAKNEIGGGGEADPFFKAICDYGNFLQEESEPWKHHSVLPCFHIILFGPCMAIFSSVFTTKIHADILGPILPLFVHPTDQSMQKLTARTFGALRIALGELESYYKGLPATPDTPARHFNPICPYPNSYLDHSGEKCDFIYDESQPDSEKRIFFAKLWNGKDICIKFVKQYSPEVHRLCAGSRHAPRLLGYETLVGGWKMVVMEPLNIYESRSKPVPQNSYHQFTYERDGESPLLQGAVLAFIRSLHSRGYVHGDLGDNNIFIRNSDTKPSTNFMLLDFEWSGKYKMAHYPMGVDRRQARQPEGVRDGMMILPEHDCDTVKYMFYPPD